MLKHYINLSTSIKTGMWSGKELRENNILRHSNLTNPSQSYD